MSLDVVVMGVSGCGKSTLAAALARSLGLPMADGDDLHPPQSVFVSRAGAREPILERMRQRQGHYMPPALLDSQLSTLERPGPDEPDVIHLPLEASIEDQVAASLRGLGRLVESRTGAT